MKNNKVVSSLILVVTLLIINTVTFLTLQTYSASRILNIICLNVAIIILWFFIFINLKNATNKYLNYSKLPIVLVYALLTILLSIILIIINPLTIVSSVIIQVIIHGIFLVLMLTNQLADNTTESLEKNQNNKIQDIRKISNKLSNLLLEIKDDKLYKKVEKIYDSSRSLKVNIKGNSEEIDSVILNLIDLLKIKLNENNLTEVENIITDINSKFMERNNL